MRTSAFVPLAVLPLLLVSMAGSASISRAYATEAGTTRQFTNAILKGDYAIADIGHGGQAPQAGISVATYDGAGAFSGVTIQNLPGQTLQERAFIRAPFTGTYTVNPDGTGNGTITVTLPGGSQDQATTALVITRTAMVDGAEVAEEFSFMHEQLGSATGNLITLTAKRRPDGGRFTNASLRGDYAYTLIGEGSRIPQAGLGIMIYDGEGSFSGSATVNLPGVTFSERRFATAPFVRPYAVNPDGTGTATPPGESDIAFVITQADLVGDMKVAKEVFFIVRELNPITGNLLTGVITKRSD